MGTTKGQTVLEPHPTRCDRSCAVDNVANDSGVAEVHGFRAFSETPSWSEASELNQEDRTLRMQEGAQNEARPRRTKAALTVGSLNISGRGSLKDDDNQNKWNQTHFFMKDDKIGILALQEAHMTASLHESLEAKYGRRLVIKYSSDPARPNANGVAFVLNKDLTNVKDIQINEIIPGRALLLTTRWHGEETVRILNVYAPNKENENAQFWLTLLELYKKLKLQTPDVLLGDFNLVEQEIDRVPMRKPPANPFLNLRKVLEEWNLIDGWRERYTDKCDFTYPIRMSSPSQSRLDRIYAKSTLCAASDKWDIRVTPVTTDHKAVLVGLAAQNTPYIGRGRWSVHPSVLKDKKTMQEIVDKGTDLQNYLRMAENSRPAGWSPQERYAKFKTEVRTFLRQRSKIVINKVNETIKRLEQDIKRTYLKGAPPDSPAHDNMAILQNRLAEMRQERHRLLKDCTTAKVALENETSSKFWSALNKEHKPRDIFFALEKPESPCSGVTYEKRSDKMATIARDYYDTLQSIPINPSQSERAAATEEVLGNVNASTTKRNRHILKDKFTREEVKAALQSSANGKASGLDGLPYEFWKQLTEFSKRKDDEEAFDPLNALAVVFQDIHENGLVQGSTFAEGWLCPIYKNKGDRRQISNYRPITLLNSDYKLMTKIIAARLALTATPLIHPNQAGFVPGRSILDQIRLTDLMFTYAEATEENGMIVALDQEKAYDRIDHAYLWRTLQHFGIPKELIATIQNLYGQAFTKVVINGEISSPFRVTRGVRQGDPMSCLLFDLAIEPLAATLRRSKLRGFQIPGAAEKLITTLFADDTTVYLSQFDNMDDLNAILNLWCRASTAKFNINKTKLIPIGTKTYRDYVSQNKRLSPSQPILANGPADPSIVPDGEAVRILGAFLGNKIDQKKIWKPISEKVVNALERWSKGHPSMEGKRLILQYIAGGVTQYLTAAQGMPTEVEDELVHIIRNFVWDNRKPKVSLDILSTPVPEGGLGIIDIRVRNKAIELNWLKKYLTFSEQRPMWALIADVLYAIAARRPLETATSGTAANPFLHYWKTAARSKTLAPPLRRMLAIAKSFNVNIYVPRLANKLKVKLPAWYHIGYGKAARRIQNTQPAKCLRQNHGVIKVEDLLHFSSRARKPQDHSQHIRQRTCQCEDCIIDTTIFNCKNPILCLDTAMKLLNALLPVWRPNNSKQMDNLSLTKHRKRVNREERENKGAITFDPSVTIDDLTALFRISQDPTTFWKPLKRQSTGAVVSPPFEFSEISCSRCQSHEEQIVKYNAILNHYPPISRSQHFTFSTLTSDETGAYLLALLFCFKNYPPYFTLHLKSVPENIVDLILDKAKTYENVGWPEDLRGRALKQILNKLRTRSAPTLLDQNPPILTREIRNKEYCSNPMGYMSELTEWEPDLNAPTPYVLPGIALSSMSQAAAYSLIRRGMKRKERKKSIREGLQSRTIVMAAYRFRLTIVFGL